MNTNYIYQTIHTLAHNPLAVAEHCRILEQHFFDIYLRPLRLDEGEIIEQIIEHLRQERATRSLSVFVELRVDINQELEITIADVSLYDGYAMRSLAPRVKIITFDSPFGLCPSSARRPLLSFAEDMARNLGGDIALECSTDGVIQSIGGAALFAVLGRRIIASTTLLSVERDIILRAAQELRLEVEEREITRHELASLDELFGCDHQGIIAASAHGEHRYMKILAQRIASHIAQPFL